MFHSMNRHVRCALWGSLAACFLVSAQARAQEDAGDAITLDKIAAGEKLYAQNCAFCHGPRMVEPGGGFFDLRTFPPHQRNRFFNSVSKGKNNMPPWGNVLSQADIGNLWAYVIAGEKK